MLAAALVVYQPLADWPAFGALIAFHKDAVCALTAGCCVAPPDSVSINNSRWKRTEISGIPQ